MRLTRSSGSRTPHHTGTTVVSKRHTAWRLAVHMAPGALCTRGSVVRQHAVQVAELNCFTMVDEEFGEPSEE
jgi:hypothetical protein